jgi:hypothetical protein
MQQEHNALRLHTNIVAQLQKFCTSESFHQRLEAEQNLLRCNDSADTIVEDSLIKKQQINKAIRLLCLRTWTNETKQKVHDNFKREFLQSYGYEHMLTLNNLEKINLLKAAETKNSYASLKKSLSLINENVDEANPNDYAFPFSMYVNNPIGKVVIFL